MVGRWSVALPLLLLLAVPVAVRAALADDPAGDVLVGDTGQKAPAGYGGIDLRSLNITETDDDFRLTVTMQEMPSPDEARDAGQGAVVTFTHNGRTFQFLMGHVNLGAGSLSPGYLRYRDTADGAWNDLWWRDPYTQVDAAARTVSAVIPRGDLADALGAAPYRGRSFDDIHVASLDLVGYFSDLCCIMGNRVANPEHMHDEMPDQGPAGPYPVQVGPEQSGTARLYSPEPFRASNGEATTYLYRVVGQNVGDRPDRFTLRTLNVPAGWRVNLPVPAVVLDPGATADIPVAVTVPFVHQHGTVSSFVVEMTGQATPGNVGRSMLGIRYLAVPQPAGHHDTVWFHSLPWDEVSTKLDPAFGASGTVFMNALEQDGNDHAKAVGPMSIRTQADQVPPTDEYSWCIRLNPGLQIGLDFDLARHGTLQVPIQTVGPLQQARLSGQLLLQPAASQLHDEWACYRRSSNLVPLAELNGTAVDVGASSAAVLSADLQPMPAADLVPHAKGQDLLLLVRIQALAVPNPLGHGAQAPTIQPGGLLQMPLVEYHDPVTASLSTASGPQLLPLGPQERQANPGDLVVFEVSAANDGDAVRTVSLNVTGTNDAWVQPPAALAVEPHTTATAQVVVQVPASAKEGESADLLLEAQEPSTGGTSLLRLRVLVDGSQDWPDDSAKVAKAEEKPSPGAILLPVLGLLGAGLVRRRR